MFPTALSLPKGKNGLVLKSILKRELMHSDSMTKKSTFFLSNAGLACFPLHCWLNASISQDLDHPLQHQTNVLGYIFSVWTWSVRAERAFLRNERTSCAWISPSDAPNLFSLFLDNPSAGFFFKKKKKKKKKSFCPIRSLIIIERSFGNEWYC